MVCFRNAGKRGSHPRAGPGPVSACGRPAGSAEGVPGSPPALLRPPRRSQRRRHARGRGPRQGRFSANSQHLTKLYKRRPPGPGARPPPPSLPAARSPPARGARAPHRATAPLPAVPTPAPPPRRARPPRGAAGKVQKGPGGPGDRRVPRRAARAGPRLPRPRAGRVWTGGVHLPRAPRPAGCAGRGADGGQWPAGAGPGLRLPRRAAAAGSSPARALRAASPQPAPPPAGARARARAATAGTRPRRRRGPRLGGCSGGGGGGAGGRAGSGSGSGGGGDGAPRRRPHNLPSSFTKN